MNTINGSLTIGNEVFIIRHNTILRNNQVIGRILDDIARTLWNSDFVKILGKLVNGKIIFRGNSEANANTFNKIIASKMDDQVAGEINILGESDIVIVRRNGRLLDQIDDN